MKDTEFERLPVGYRSPILQKILDETPPCTSKFVRLAVGLSDLPEDVLDRLLPLVRSIIKIEEELGREVIRFQPLDTELGTSRIKLSTPVDGLSTLVPFHSSNPNTTNYKPDGPSNNSI